MKKIRILIPAYNPDERLIQLYNELTIELPETPIIIINDGSLSSEFFDCLNSQENPPEKILTHSVNLGKGEALKNGFKYITDNIPECIGIVTADCDLQHSVSDIIKMVKTLETEPDKLYLGSRIFTNTNVPSRSLVGNTIMSMFMNFIHKIDVKDTQTGLRGIPANFAKHLLQLNVSDFSFETEMLMEAKYCNIPIKEIPIQTIYINNNKHSHFKPIRDSYKIIKSVIRSKNV